MSPFKFPLVPCAAHQIRVFGASQAAVVASEGAEEVAFFDVQIMAQDGAAVAQVGPHVEQVVIGGADEFYPEGHDLHVAARASAGHCVFSETGFDLHQAQHQLRVKPGAGRFVVDGA